MRPIPIELDARLERKYVDQVIELDRANYEQDPFPAALAWAEQKPWLYTLLRRGETVLGYGLVIPLIKNAFEALKEGRIWEDEITLDDISETSPDGYYLASIAASADANYRERALIVGSTVGQLLRISKEVIAVPISEAGEKIARMIHMEEWRCSLKLPGIETYRPRLFVRPVECNRELYR